MNEFFKKNPGGKNWIVKTDNLLKDLGDKILHGNFATSIYIFFIF